MSKQNKFFGFKFSLLAVICFLAFSNVSFASVNENPAYSIVAKNLSLKLQNDLADSSAVVKLNNVKEYRISKNQFGIKGDGVCVLANKNNQLPIRFDAKLDAGKQIVSDIEYDFVNIENTPDFAPTSTEEILMKELMKQISKNYKTDNIVIAIDGFESISNLSNQKKFTGIGEVRIGDFVWNKIKFDLVLNSENNSANKVVYKIEK